MQFDTLVVKENIINGEEQEIIITDQKSIAGEVRNFYWKLYRRQEVVVSTDEIRNVTGHIKKISNEEKPELEQKITIEELSKCLNNNRNNVAQGCGGFSGALYKVFWCFLKYVVLGAIHQIIEDKQLPITLRLGIIALIPKRTKEKRCI